MTVRIVVPLDGSARDVEALDAARGLARHLGASLLLIRAEPSLPLLAQVIADEQQLAAYVATLAADSFEARYLVEIGRPDAVIAAATHGQDIVVLTPQHRGMLEILRHPSVTKALLARATVPMVVLPEITTEQPARPMLADRGNAVIVPLDGSGLAEGALPLAIAFANAYQRDLLLVRVVPTIFVAGAGPETTRLRRKAQLTEEIEARDYLTTLRARVREEHDSEAQTLLLHGEPAECLTRLSGQHLGSLLVMSTRGRGGLGRAILGSVAAEVARRTAIPLVVVPPAATSYEAQP